MSYQCFLLDKDNKVLLIGNLTFNPKIWDLYKQTVLEEERAKQKVIACTTAEVDRHEIESQNVKDQKPSVATFVIKNTGDAPLVIKDITVSCGCTVPESGIKNQLCLGKRQQ